MLGGWLRLAPILEIPSLKNQITYLILRKMEAKTFILTKTKTWRREVRIHILNQNKKYDAKLIPFTTENIVPSKQRNTRGHQVPAEFTTTDPIIIEALFRDPSYGKDFVEKGDPEGKKKQPTVVITETDSKLIALRNLYKLVNLPFDETLPIEVLKAQYDIHMDALGGKAAEKSAPLQIPHVPVDVKASIEAGVNTARAAYLEKYGEPIPAIVENDLGFLDALADPNFDAQKYIENKVIAAQEPPKDEEPEAPEVPEAPEADNKEDLAAKYFEKFKTNVPNPKKNDVAWIKAKLAE